MLAELDTLIGVLFFSALLFIYLFAMHAAATADANDISSIGGMLRGAAAVEELAAIAHAGTLPYGGANAVAAAMLGGNYSIASTPHQHRNFTLRRIIPIGGRLYYIEMWR